MDIRPYQASDLEAMYHLFYETVHRINQKDYSKDQLDAWAPKNFDRAKWEKRFSNLKAYVACDEDECVGFISMNDQGYLDHFYLHHAYQGHLVASRLFKKILVYAKTLGVRKITSDVSKSALPIAKKVGFKLIKKQTIVKEAIKIENFKVEMLI